MNKPIRFAAHIHLKTCALTNRIHWKYDPESFLAGEALRTYFRWRITGDSSWVGAQ